MNKTFTNILLLLSSTFVLFLAGMMFFESFFDMMLPKVDNAFYEADIFPFRTVWLFSIAMASSALLLFLVWKIAGIQKINYKITSVLIVLLFALLGIIIRHYIIKGILGKLVKEKSVLEMQFTASFPVSRLYFEWYLLAGIVMGCVIS